MHLVIVTSPPCNIRSLETVLEYLKFEKAEKQRYLRAFRDENKPQYAHVCLDLNRLSVTVMQQDKLGKDTRTEMNCLLSGNENSLAASMISELENPGKANAVFQLIYRHLPQKKMNKDDLTLTLTSSKSGESVRISLIEYLDCLTTPSRSPTRDILNFHKFVTRKIYIPLPFRLNKAFR
jgi:hypothetical protein